MIITIPSVKRKNIIDTFILALVFYFAQSYEVAASLSVDDEYGEVYEWEGLFQDRMRQKAAGVDTLNVAYFTGRSMDDSLAESVSGEVFLFVVTCESLHY